jgi:multiple sugar transport system substrate-binding protein
MNSKTLAAVAILGTAWLAGCARSSPAPTDRPETAIPAGSPTATASESGRIRIRLLLVIDRFELEQESGSWTVDQDTVEDFNASQDEIQLALAPMDGDLVTTLTSGFAAGNGPDIVGAMGRSAADRFRDQWLDLSPYIRAGNYDVTQFNPALMRMYDTPEGLVSLPFAVNPSVLFFNTALFDRAGLDYPPAAYGRKYSLPDGTRIDWDWDAVRTIARLLTLDAEGRNASQAGFNPSLIVQYGFTWQWENHPSYWGSFWSGGSLLVPGGSPGRYAVRAPEAWEAAWKWTYDAIWGKRPFLASAAVEGSREFGDGNPFNSGKVAMTVQPAWLTCCIDGAPTWDAAALPAYGGTVGGRIDEAAFRIWKGTRHPQEAFAALAYLVDEGTRRLILGSEGMPAAYGAMPARTADQEAWMEIQQEKFPWVKNWDVFVDGLHYPDIPGAESDLPNRTEAWMRGNAFADLLRGTAGLDPDREIAEYLSDLEAIFNKK